MNQPRLLILASIASPLFAQMRGPNPPAAALADQSRAQAVSQAAAQARFRADLTVANPARPEDPGRARVQADPQGAVSGRATLSPYGGYYRIRTPWDPQ